MQPWDGVYEKRITSLLATVAVQKIHRIDRDLVVHLHLGQFCLLLRVAVHQLAESPEPTPMDFAVASAVFFVMSA